MNVSNLAKKEVSVKNSVERANLSLRDYLGHDAQQWYEGRKDLLRCDKHDCQLDLSHWLELLCGLCLEEAAEKQAQCL